MTRVNTVIIRHVYINKTVVVHRVVRVAYNGGPGGLRVHPTPEQRRVVQHLPMTPVQKEHVAEAQRNRNNLTTVNHGAPMHTVVVKPLSPSNRPPDFKPVTAADRQNAPHAKPQPHPQPPHPQQPHPQNKPPK